MGFVKRTQVYGGRSCRQPRARATGKTLVRDAGAGPGRPDLASCHVIRVWSGIEGYLPDMIPVIGPSETTPGLFHAFGFCGHGFQIGPGVGLCLSEMIVDGGPRPLWIPSRSRASARLQLSARNSARSSTTDQLGRDLPGARQLPESAPF